MTGLVLSLGKLLYAFSHLDVNKEEDVAKNRIDLHFDGSATLVRLPILARALEDLQPGSNVHVHLADLDYIDHACLDLLTNWEKQHKATGGTLTMDWAKLEGKYHHRHGTGNGGNGHGANGANGNGANGNGTGVRKVAVT